MLRRIKRRLRRIRRRYQEFTSQFQPVELRASTALRQAFRKGYGLPDLRADLLAGVTVGVVALPLSMALAIAVGMPPQYGLYTAIVGGAVAALLSGSPTQVTGPTAAFVVLLVPIVAHHGLSGLLVATLLAGLILIVLSLARMGQLIQYIPAPVTTGFTMGIAVVIALLQVKDLLGLDTGPLPQHFAERVHALYVALPTLQLPELGMGLFTLAVLILWPRLTHRIPAPLVALVLAALGGSLLERLLPGETVRTIGDTFSFLQNGVTLPGIPRTPPVPLLPWALPGAEPLTLDTIRTLLPAAFAIAMLGAIESLLSATVADGMAGTRSDPDAELLAQGAANMLAPFFGGFAATGALARTATNIRAGARSPLAALFHALFILAAMLACAPALAHVPMAAFAALLLLVAWNMSDWHAFAHIVRVAPRSDVTVALTCFGLTILFDMVVAVTAGIMLAGLLFIRRMVEISGTTLVDQRGLGLREPLPAGVELYEINGPLFFGAAVKAMEALEAIAKAPTVLILSLEAVPAMDVTGLVNLEETLEKLQRKGTFVILAGLQEQPARVLERAEIRPEPGDLAFATSVHAAIEVARAYVNAPRPEAGSPAT